MFSDFFINNLWASIGVWVILSISDSFLTVVGARLYQSGVKKHFLSSGSYELEPDSQVDVDRFRVISFGFLVSLILYGGLIWIIHSSGFIKLFALIWGGLIFSQIAVHLRHFRNLIFFSYAKLSAGVEGQIRYERWLSLRLSASDFFGFGVLLLVVYLFTSSLVIMGGAAACSLIAARHWLMSINKNPKREVLDSSRT